MPIKVMLVDDSAIIRGLISKALTKHASIEIVGTAINGKIAIDVARFQKPDVIILDIEMPEMDGITALPKLLEVSPQSHIIMASTLTQANAAISIKALELGASDYIPKPSSTGDKNNLDIFYESLVRKVLALGGSDAAKSPSVAYAPAASAKSTPLGAEVKLDARKIGHPIKALAVASSTGGPKALQDLFTALQGQLMHVPIFITQHMPPTFTGLLANNIGKYSQRPGIEAKAGDAVQPGHIYVAPGDYHMTVTGPASQAKIALNQDAPESFCRPAADPMLRSLANVYGNQLLLVVLTGMGHDGYKGAQFVVEKGGYVIAQNKETSVVYGMPKAVAEAGLCTEILPLQEIASYLIQKVRP